MMFEVGKISQSERRCWSAFSFKTRATEIVNVISRGGRDLVVLSLICFLIPLGLGQGALIGQDPPLFNDSIRPILSDRCYPCHGPDSESREAGLRLDIRDSASDSGVFGTEGSAEVPLLERVTSSDPDLRMPPPDSGDALTAKEVELLEAWIRAGAEYESHWAFERIGSTAEILEQLRRSEDTDSGREVGGDTNDESVWAERPVDRLVEVVTRKKGLSHSPPAAPDVLLRRVTEDLTGLPPSVEQLREFLEDRRSNALQFAVDRLLKSSAYGERMAAHWMDVARYADTFGYQNDMEMQVWPWRDWVIDAFNKNMPYDQFVMEQIAGDRLPEATQEQRLATTFNRLHRQTNEGGSVAEEFRVAGVSDRTTTAATAFLGLTMECCRCHDHKFDPISQRDFYQLSAYFADIDEFGLYAHFTRAVPSPSLSLYTPDQQKQRELLDKELAYAEGALDEAKRQAGERLRGIDLSSGLGELVDLQPAFEDGLEGAIEGVVGNARRFNGDDEFKLGDAPELGRESRFSLSFWMKPPNHSKRMTVLHQSRAADDSGFRGLQVVLDEGRLEFSMIHFWPGNAARVVTKEKIPPDAWSQVVITHDGSGRVKGMGIHVNGVKNDVDVIRDQLTLDVRHRKEWGDSDVGNLRLTLGARFRDVGFIGGALDEIKLFNRDLTSFEITQLHNEVTGQSNTVTDAEMLKHAVTLDDAVVECKKELDLIRRRENDFSASVRRIMTMSHNEKAVSTFILHRGEYTEKREAVTAAVPSQFFRQNGSGMDRLDLARWIVDRDNPLTARVIANRIWYLMFGRGIVASLEDFGAQGTPPTHPLLLDYLAAGLMENDWDLHWLIREIVFSKTYQQSSHSDPESTKRDPNNEWLTRGPKHRLSAEQLRDLILFTSGLLVPEVGGPSVKPYQPVGLWREAGTGKTYQQSQGDGLYRRSLYTFWRRTSPPPSMLTLDATSRESCTPRRESTTTPLQALVFLNDPQYVEAARELASALLGASPSPGPQRWSELCLRLLSREPTRQELAVFQDAYEEQKQLFEEGREDASGFLSVGERPVREDLDSIDLAATTVVVQMLFAYDETIMKR